MNRAMENSPDRFRLKVKAVQRFAFAKRGERHAGNNRTEMIR
jgi:hypothetical protein